MRRNRQRQKQQRKRDQRRQEHQQFELMEGPNHALEVDYLDVDPPVSGQDLVLVSFLGVGEDQKTELIRRIANDLSVDYDTADHVIRAWIEHEHPKRGFKVRGVFSKDDIPIIETRINHYRSMGEPCHTFCGQVGKWGPFDPKPELVDKIEGQNYYERELNTLMKGSKLSAAKSKQYFERRREEMLRKAIFEGTPEGQKILMEQQEPVEAVQHRLETAKAAEAELEEKLKEAKRVQELAAKKLEILQESPEEDDDDVVLMPPTTTESSEPKVPVQQEDIEKLREIDRSRKAPQDPLFGGETIIPSQRRQEDAEEAERLLIEKFKEAIAQNPQLRDALLKDMETQERKDRKDSKDPKDPKVL